jgi:hypothetical protein
MSPLRWNQTLPLSRSVASTSPTYICESTSSQHSVPLNNLRYTVCELRLSYTDANAAVLLQLLLMMQTCQFAVQFEPLIFWDMSLI